ncbi:stage II sporulation protein M, partial [Anaerosalibacter bizertensis]|nr:stage II sporulation protein M [Anaerosalibacter bizertensis]
KGQVISFFNSFFKLISNDEVDSFLLLKESILNNLKTIFLIWITEIIIIGIPIIPIIILLRGFAIGFTVGFLVNEFGIKGLLFALFSILPQNLFVIPGIISISSIGMVNSLNSIRRKRLQSTYNHKLTNFINYSVIIFIFSIIIMIGSLVEAYITPIFMRLITDYIY